MSSSCFHCSRKIAYIVLSQNQKAGEAKLKAIQDYCRTLLYEVDIFAEEVVPKTKQSPLFKQIIELMSQGEVSELIIPNISHVIGHRSHFQKRIFRILGKKSRKSCHPNERAQSFSFFSRR